MEAFILPDKRIGDPPFALNGPVSTNPSKITYSSSSPNVASIEDNIVTIHSCGKVEITAFQPQGGGYDAISSVATLTINPSSDIPVLSNFFVVRNLQFKPISLPERITPPETTIPGSFSYVVSDPSVAMISTESCGLGCLYPGLLIHKPGTVTVTATWQKQCNTGTASISTTLTILP